ncbi:MAG: NUDIX domain-containing protein [Spirochaetales bacterium]|nr:NUDIX domain-containing protein [Spirochaetales bacterium]
MIFRYCPSCRSGRIETRDSKEYLCGECGYVFFFNPAAAVAALIFRDEKLLVIKRSNDPGKGKLDLPGGFVDPGESLEEALEREVREELDVQITECRYHASFPNIYEYKGIRYNVCDCFFMAEIRDYPDRFDKSEIEEIRYVDPAVLKEKDIAFPTSWSAISLHLKQRRTA